MPPNNDDDNMGEPPNRDSVPASPYSFSRPRPRPPRSPEQVAKIRVQNRRREYLQKHPGYFNSVEHELADPDLYDTVVRRFQTPAERESEGRSRGWGKVLESSLLRSEARLERVASSYSGDVPPRPAASTARKEASATRTTPTTAAAAAAVTSTSQDTTDAAAAAAAIADFARDADLLADNKPETREEGRAAWEDFLRERFVRGGDEDFDYTEVDGNEDLDAMEQRDREDQWFDEEDPEWADDSADDDQEGDTDMKGSRRERILTGETGVQDY